MAGLYYRGQDVLKLAEKATLEEVAELLWGGGNTERGALQHPDPRPFGRSRRFGPPRKIRWSGFKPPCRWWKHWIWPLRSASGGGAPDRRRIVRLLTTIIAGRVPKGPVHRALQAAWAPGRRRSAR